jgi:hypothetical protein
MGGVSIEKKADRSGGRCLFGVWAWLRARSRLGSKGRLRQGHVGAERGKKGQRRCTGSEDLHFQRLPMQEKGWRIVKIQWENHRVGRNCLAVCFSQVTAARERFGLSLREHPSVLFLAGLGPSSPLRASGGLRVR